MKNIINVSFAVMFCYYVQSTETEESVYVSIISEFVEHYCIKMIWMLNFVVCIGNER